MSFFENTRKPVSLGGKIMAAMMNVGRGTLAGERPELFSKEVQVAHRHSLKR